MQENSKIYPFSEYYWWNIEKNSTKLNKVVQFSHDTILYSFMNKTLTFTSTTTSSKNICNLMIDCSFLFLSSNKSYDFMTRFIAQTLDKYSYEARMILNSSLQNEYICTWCFLFSLQLCWIMFSFRAGKIMFNRSRKFVFMHHFPQKERYWKVSY